MIIELRGTWRGSVHNKFKFLDFLKYLQKRGGGVGVGNGWGGGHFEILKKKDSVEINLNKN